MAFSLCFIGNSHLAAVKQAWTNRNPDVAPGVSVTFFSAGTHLLPQLRLEDGAWVCASEPLREKIVYTSDGLDRIEFARYDAFALFGTGFGLDLAKLLADCDLPTGAGRDMEATPVSRACLAAVIETNLESALAIRMIDTIRSVCDKPIMLCAAPYLSQRVLEEEGLSGQARLRDRALQAFAVSAAKEAGIKIAGRHGIEIVWQDESTMEPAGFTKKEFGINPVRFAMRGFSVPPTDRKHGNEDYGYLSLMAALAGLQQLSGGRVLPEARNGRPRRASAKTT